MAANWKNPPPSDTLFMWNVPHGTTEDTLVDFLESSFGANVLWKKIFAKKANALSALVQLDSVEKATEIKDALHDSIPEGSTLPMGVTFKEVKDDSKGGGGKGGSWSEKAENVETDNLYMQNLPPGVDKDILEVYFSEFGPIVDYRILHGGTAGLVRFESSQQGQAVITEMNGKLLPGASAPLVVRPATKKSSYGKDQSKGESKGSAKSGAPPRDPVVTTSGLFETLVGQNLIPDATKAENNCFVLYVCGLPLDADEGLLYKMFSPFGAILSVCLQRKKATAGHDYVIASVNFSVQEAAENAVGIYNQTQLPDGTYLKVVWSYEEAEYVAGNFSGVPGAEAHQFLNNQNEELQNGIEKLRQQMSNYQHSGEEAQTWSASGQTQSSGKRSLNELLQNEELTRGLIEKLRRIQAAKYDQF